MLDPSRLLRLISSKTATGICVAALATGAGTIGVMAAVSGSGPAPEATTSSTTTTTTSSHATSSRSGRVRGARAAAITLPVVPRAVAGHAVGSARRGRSTAVPVRVPAAVSGVLPRGRRRVGGRRVTGGRLRVAPAGVNPRRGSGRGRNPRWRAGRGRRRLVGHGDPGEGTRGEHRRRATQQRLGSGRGGQGAGERP